MDFAPFRQSVLLNRYQPTDETRQGVCVALCDHWISRVQEDPSELPPRRLDYLAAIFPAVVEYQRRYGRLRAAHGPRTARESAAATLGIGYDTDTTDVTATLIPGGRQLEHFRSRLVRDIDAPGKTATWTLRFASGGGHAIAGFCGLAGREPILHHRLHLFDPNVGEYRGTRNEVNAMLDNLLTRIPLYRTTTMIRRALVT